MSSSNEQILGSISKPRLCFKSTRHTGGPSIAQTHLTLSVLMNVKLSRDVPVAVIMIAWKDSFLCALCLGHLLVIIARAMTVEQHCCVNFITVNNDHPLKCWLAAISKPATDVGYLNFHH